jgi:hypothetical protein
MTERAYCLGCGLEVGALALIEGKRVTDPSYAKAYVVDPHVVQRVRFILRRLARERGGEPEWAYHLKLLWVPRQVRGESVRGYWQRGVCGPTLLGEPETTWERDV